jgi:hypothetical protein
MSPSITVKGQERTGKGYRTQTKSELVVGGYFAKKNGEARAG